jgi:hypothetical protein
VILGHQHQDPVIAAALGLPRSKKGELLSVRLHPADPDDREVVEIDGACWRRALSTDEPVMAPAITRDSIVRARSDEPA